MSRMSLSRRLASVLTALLAVVVLAKPAYPQGEGMIRGTVRDAEGQTVAGATIVVAFQGGVTRQFETTSNDQGAYIQIGLMPGPYTVTAEKEGVGRLTMAVTLRAGQRVDMDFQLMSEREAALASISEEDRARLEKAEAASGAFDQGIAATQAGNFDEAIAKFTEALEQSPDCGDCYRNLGIVYTRTEDYGRAEAALKSALELDPEDAAAYDGLAHVYNAQGKFDEAAEASAQAAKLAGGGAAQAGSATAVFDQGLIFWNAGRIADAKKQFEETLQLDPDHGEVHYWLGMATLNEGKIPEAAAELKLYIERDTDGRFAEQAAGILAQIQP